MHVADGASLYGDKFKPQTLKDDDHDGVINERDVCPNTPLGTLVTIQGCPEVTPSILTMDMKVLFDSNKYEVKPHFYSQILRLADFMNSYPESKVVIEGYTDNSGNKAKNLLLSQRRASAIAALLIKKFKIDKSRVKAIGYGDIRPITTNDTPEGRATNRRVIANVTTTKKETLQKWTIYSVDKDIK